MRKHIQTHLNFKDKSYYSEENTEPSEVIPNEVLSLREMEAQYSRGMPIFGSSREAVYSELELPDFEKMDLTEIAEYREDIQADLDAYKEMAEIAAKEEAKKLAKAELMAEIEKENLLLKTPPREAQSENDA